MSTFALAAAGLVLVTLVVLALLRPTVSLATLVALDVSNINGVIADHLGTSPYKPQLAVALLALLVLACRKRFTFARSPVLLGLLVLMAGFCLSLVNAADPAVSERLLLAHSRDLFYFLVVFALMLSTRSLTLVAKASVLILGALAALTVVHEFVLHDAGDLFGLSRVPLVQEGGALTPRHAGTSSDVNFWARLLILFAPLAMSLLAISRTSRGRLLWLGCTLSLLIGIYLTQSRGGFIALLIGLVLWLALAGGRYRKAILFLPIALVVIVPLTGIGSRLQTLVATAAGSAASGDPSVLTRKRLQLDAWHMFVDRPVFGHGIGSYGTLFPSYDRLSNAYQPVDIVVAAHNFYLEQAADGGVVLLLAWAIFIGTMLFAAVRSLSITRDSALNASRFLSVGIISGVAGWAVASVFLHLSDFRALLVVAAMAAVVDVRTRQLAQPRPMPLISIQQPSGRLAITGLLAVSVIAAGGLVFVLMNRGQTYSNTATLAVVPSSQTVDGSTAYQVDVVSRGVIVPTLTEVLIDSVTTADLQRLVPAGERDPVAVTVAQSRLGGSIVVSVTGRTQDVATDLGAAAVTLCKAKIADLNSSYQLTGTMNISKPSNGAPGWAVPPLAAVTLLALVLAVTRWLNLGRNDPPPRRAARFAGMEAG
jgi:O-antigen ligase